MILLLFVPVYRTQELRKAVEKPRALWLFTWTCAQSSAEFSAVYFWHFHHTNWDQPYSIFVIQTENEYDGTRVRHGHILAPSCVKCDKFSHASWRKLCASYLEWLTVANVTRTMKIMEGLITFSPEVKKNKRIKEKTEEKKWRKKLLLGSVETVFVYMQRCLVTKAGHFPRVALMSWKELFCWCWDAFQQVVVHKWRWMNFDNVRMFFTLILITEYSKLSYHHNTVRRTSIYKTDFPAGGHCFFAVPQSSFFLGPLSLHYVILTQSLNSFSLCSIRVSFFFF